jgi:hypothetical protein
MRLFAKPTIQSIKLIILVMIIAVSVLSLRQIDLKNLELSESPITEKFQLFTFNSKDQNQQVIKTTFLAKNPYNDFLKLKKSSKILFASSASFVLSLDMKENPPVGFCAENGEILNKLPNPNMDALVLFDKKKQDIEDLHVLNLDNDWSKCEKMNCNTHFSHNNIRYFPSTSYEFFQLINQKKISGFQTNLVYTNTLSDTENFKSLTNGTNDRSRRFLAICESKDQIQHVIIDCLEENYLMISAKNALNYLRKQNYNVVKMINLDTGSKDIIYAHNGEFLQNLRPNPQTEYATIENASSLLVYYTDK